jgi:hypothetical protein
VQAQVDERRCAHERRARKKQRSNSAESSAQTPPRIRV